MKSLIVKLSIIGVVLFICEGLGVDLFIQDLFFFNGRWLIEGNPFDSWFYTGPKIFLISLVLLCIGIFFFQPLYRIHALSIVVCLSLIPLSVSLLKQTTCVYCPKQINRYGGKFPYLNIFQGYFREKPKGHCFPAGHASGGFALFCLYFLFPLHRKILLPLVLGLGWTMALYQMARGQHYLSHSLITMILSFWMSSLICWFIPNIFQKFTGLKKNQLSLKNQQK